MFRGVMLTWYLEPGVKHLNILGSSLKTYCNLKTSFFWKFLGKKLITLKDLFLDLKSLEDLKSLRVIIFPFCFNWFWNPIKKFWKFIHDHENLFKCMYHKRGSLRPCFLCGL